jgi:hypothetical protein
MVETNPSEIIESGVDWFTGTSHGPKAGRKLYNSGMRLVSFEHRQGNEKKPWRFAGYDGWKSGGAQVGMRHDGSVVRLSGGFANEHWAEIFERCDNVSRLDLQVTVRMQKEVNREIARWFRQACKASRASSRGPTVSTFRTVDGGSTLYLGSRSSTNFGRIYDKGDESRLAHYAGCVRFERETKDVIALRLASSIYSAGDRPKFIADQVHRWLQNRGIGNPFAYHGSIFIKSLGRASDREKSLTWIARGVAPTVARLIEQGCLVQVLDALNLQQGKQGLRVRLRSVG